MTGLVWRLMRWTNAEAIAPPTWMAMVFVTMRTYASVSMMLVESAMDQEPYTIAGAK